jgi:dynein heavy chain, axonemal
MLLFVAHSCSIGTRAFLLACVCSSPDQHAGDIGRLLKGISLSGAWGCIGQLSNLTSAVLSAAVQLLHVLVLSKRAVASALLFPGDPAPFTPCCSFQVFVTEELHAAAALPDSMRALFRTVALSRPDFEVIALTRLVAAGYTDAQRVARKICSCLLLCRESLSPATPTFALTDLRAGCSVVDVACAKYRDEVVPRDDELAAAHASLYSVLSPSIASGPDTLVFQGILSALFHSQLPITVRSNIGAGAVDAVDAAIMGECAPFRIFEFCRQAVDFHTLE